jgi:hypothetical protein
MHHLKTALPLLMALFIASSSSAAENPVLSSISLSSATVVGGNTVQATVTLDREAPFDLSVSLVADPSRTVKLPASVTIPAGSTSATLTITTLLNKSAVVGSDTRVTIYGNYGVTKNSSFIALAPVSLDRMVDQVVERERALVATLKQMHPLAETYIQNLQENKDHDVTPVSDQYFLGRLDIHEAPAEELFEKQPPGGFRSHFMNPFKGIFARKFLPAGFAQMVMLDMDFQKSNYYFNFVRQEFLGEVRCIVVDVQPRDAQAKGRFMGRMWVEDRDFNIVRFVGTYSSHSRDGYYLHLDSWRLNLQPGIWLPAYIYTEESGSMPSGPTVHGLYFKAQTRLWGYDVEQLKHSQEVTQIHVDRVSDQSESGRDAGPVEASRVWQRMAEDNTVDHLQKIGLLAPLGSVDQVLQTVVNNLIITNKLEIVPDVRCRVLLTTPLESFTIGHTIIVSRGLLDVLPDEGSLAAVLAHELSHVALNHRIDTKLAFNDRFFFADENTFQRIQFTRSPADEEAADRKALEILGNSPYKDKLASAGLFLKALQARAPQLPSLIRAHLGNSLGNKKDVRLSALVRSAPQLEPASIDQNAALPLGGRIKLDPWSNRLEMMKIRPVALLSPQEKMPFEVTPFSLYLTRFSDSEIAVLK